MIKTIKFITISLIVIMLTGRYIGLFSWLFTIIYIIALLFLARYAIKQERNNADEG